MLKVIIGIVMLLYMFAALAVPYALIDTIGLYGAAALTGLFTLPLTLLDFVPGPNQF